MQVRTFADITDVFLVTHWTPALSGGGGGGDCMRATSEASCLVSHCQGHTAPQLLQCRPPMGQPCMNAGLQAKNTQALMHTKCNRLTHTHTPVYGSVYDLTVKDLTRLCMILQTDWI